MGLQEAGTEGGEGEERGVLLIKANREDKDVVGKRQE